ncbi:Uncharacterised protein [Vibrio cholerae]|nr:Uncharacterised protein [Vibrio cholerae]CSI34124.1 Uncharacterised protein [Vibrio cholerae]
MFLCCMKNSNTHRVKSFFFNTILVQYTLFCLLTANREEKVHHGNENNPEFNALNVSFSD